MPEQVRQAQEDAHRRQPTYQQQQQQQQHRPQEQHSGGAATRYRLPNIPENVRAAYQQQ